MRDVYAIPEIEIIGTSDEETKAQLLLLTSLMCLDTVVDNERKLLVNFTDADTPILTPHGENTLGQRPYDYALARDTSRDEMIAFLHINRLYGEDLVSNLALCLGDVVSFEIEEKFVDSEVKNNQDIHEVYREVRSASAVALGYLAIRSAYMAGLVSKEIMVAYAERYLILFGLKYSEFIESPHMSFSLKLSALMELIALMYTCEKDFTDDWLKSYHITTKTLVKLKNKLFELFEKFGIRTVQMIESNDREESFSKIVGTTTIEDIEEVMGYIDTLKAII